MAKKANKILSDPVQTELVSIKRLLMLLLVKAGAKEDEIALAMGASQSKVSNMLPARKVEKFAFVSKD